jgi:hypothetical protein
MAGAKRAERFAREVDLDRVVDFASAGSVKGRWVEVVARSIATMLSGKITMDEAIIVCGDIAANK